MLLALMVMPRSRSRSIESSTCAVISRSLSAPVNSSKRSASVDFPWSICAMMQKFRMNCGSMYFRAERSAAGKARQLRSHRVPQNIQCATLRTVQPAGQFAGNDGVSTHRPPLTTTSTIKDVDPPYKLGPHPNRVERAVSLPKFKLGLPKLVVSIKGHGLAHYL